MDQAQRAQLVSTYIERFTKTFKADAEGIIREHSGATEENFWAFLKLDEICRADPGLALDIVLEILHAPHVDSVAEILAAGPLEDVLMKFGPTTIERVEALAKSDPSFRDLLGGVWTSGMDTEVAARVDKCRGSKW
jgi:hypothetical protein